MHQVHPPPHFPAAYAPVCRGGIQFCCEEIKICPEGIKFCRGGIQFCREEINFCREVNFCRAPVGQRILLMSTVNAIHSTLYGQFTPRGFKVVQKWCHKNWFVFFLLSLYV